MKRTPASPRLFRASLFRNERRTVAFVGWVVLCLALSGCANVVSISDTVEAGGVLPLLTSTQLSEDSVIVEVGFVNVPQNSEDWNRDLWSELDEQHLKPELRRRLASNGIRCGVSGEQIPPGLRAALDAVNDTHTAMFETIEGVEERGAMHRRIQTRSGKRSEVVTATTQESMVVLVHDGEEVAGHTFRQAQPLMALRAFPQGDGRSRIELTPEIQHGPSRQRWVGREGAFQLDAGQFSEVFSRLAIDTVLAPGQTLVVAASGPGKSLGGNFFGLDNKDRKEKMLLIRLAQSQYDDLFAANELVDQAVQSEVGQVVEEQVEEEDESMAGLITELD